MLGLVEIIFSVIGLFGIYINSSLCMLIGLLGIIICDFIDIFIAGHNPTTILFAIVLAMGSSLSNKNPLFSFSLALCGENFIMSFFTFLVVGWSSLKIKLYKHKNINKYNRMVELLQNNLHVSNIDEIINIIYKFYIEQGLNIPSFLSNTSNLPENEKILNLLKMFEIALGVEGIDNVLPELEKFYS